MRVIHSNEDGGFYSYVVTTPTKVTRLSDSKVVGQYRYDALSRRVAKIMPLGLETHYLYDDARIVEEQNANNVTLATYVYGNYIDEVLNMERGGQNYYYHQNALWSVASITDGAGNVVERYSYDAYGNPQIIGAVGVIPVSSIGNTYMFTGRQWDDESGLYSYRARFYDPLKGRFLQRDVKEYEEGVNLYEYLKSNPINGLDPSGTWKWKTPKWLKKVGNVVGGAIVGAVWGAILTGNPVGVVAGAIAGGYVGWNAKVDGGSPPSPSPSPSSTSSDLSQNNTSGSCLATGLAKTTAGGYIPVCIDTTCAKSPFDGQTIATAAKAAYDKIKDGNCIFSNALKESLLSVFDKLTITCDPTLSNDVCGHANNIGPFVANKITIGSCALSRNKIPLASTILHEAVHRTQWINNERTAYSCEKSCFDVDDAGFTYSSIDCK